MEIQFTPDQEAFVRQAIQMGRLQHREQAVQEALLLWEQRERVRAEILTSVDTAEESIALGKGIPITEESMRRLAQDVKQRGRLRLAAERETIRS